MCSKFNKSFSESGQSAYQEMLAVTSEFNHSSKDYVNYDSTNLSAQIQKSK